MIRLLCKAREAATATTPRGFRLYLCLAITLERGALDLVARGLRQHEETLTLASVLNFAVVAG